MLQIGWEGELCRKDVWLGSIFGCIGDLVGLDMWLSWRSGWVIDLLGWMFRRTIYLARL